MKKKINKKYKWIRHKNNDRTWWPARANKKGSHSPLYPSQRIYTRGRYVPDNVKELSIEIRQLTEFIGLTEKNLQFLSYQIGSPVSDYTINKFINPIYGVGWPPKKQTLENLYALRNKLRDMKKSLCDKAREKHKQNKKQNNQ